MTTGAPKKRKHVRYQPDPNTLVVLSFQGREAQMERLTGLVFSESYGGCGLVLLHSDRIRPGMQCTAQVGVLDALPAEIVWINLLDEQVMKVGLKFLK